MSGYPVVVEQSVPAIGQIPSGSLTPFNNDRYRTLTAVDIDAAIVGHIGNGGILGGASAIDIGVYYALQYLSATYGPASGMLIDTTGTVPVFTSGDGHAVEYTANVPVIGDVASGDSVSEDAALLWLYRTFGKR